MRDWITIDTEGTRCNAKAGLFSSFSCSSVCFILCTSMIKSATAGSLIVYCVLSTAKA